LYQKHGFGLKICSKEKLYIGTFIKDEFEGFGVLIYNIKEKFPNNNISSNNNSNNNNSIYNNNNNNIDEKKNYINCYNNCNSKGDFINNSLSEFIENEKGKFLSFRILDSKSKEENSSRYRKSSFSSESSYCNEEFDIQFAIYIGEFINGECNGKGELFLPNGEYYVGEFKNNKCNGYGEYHFQNNTFYRGEFINNKIKGIGEYGQEEFKKFRLKEKFIKL
jgi:hypothetical protein